MTDEGWTKKDQPQEPKPSQDATVRKVLLGLVVLALSPVWAPIAFVGFLAYLAGDLLLWWYRA